MLVPLEKPDFSVKFEISQKDKSRWEQIFKNELEMFNDAEGIIRDQLHTKQQEARYGGSWRPLEFAWYKDRVDESAEGLEYELKRNDCPNDLIKQYVSRFKTMANPRTLYQKVMNVVKRW